MKLRLHLAESSQEARGDKADAGADADRRRQRNHGHNGVPVRAKKQPDQRCCNCGYADACWQYDETDRGDHPQISPRACGAPAAMTCGAPPRPSPTSRSVPRRRRLRRRPGAHPGATPRVWRRVQTQSVAGLCRERLRTPLRGRRRAARDFLRAAVFLCRAPFWTALSIRETSSLCSAATAVGVARPRRRSRAGGSGSSRCWSAAGSRCARARCVGSASSVRLCGHE